MYLVTLSYYAAGYNPSSFLQKLQKCVKRRFCWGECTDLNSPLESSVVSQISSINLMICESLQHFTSMVLCRSVTINSCWIRRSGSWWSLVHKVEVCFYPVLDTDSKDVWENASNTWFKTVKIQSCTKSCTSPRGFVRCLRAPTSRMSRICVLWLKSRSERKAEGEWCW